jgi:hypothetical protein
VNTALIEQWLDQIEHGGPFAEEHSLVVTIDEELFEQFIESLQFGRVSGGFFVNECGTVGGHAAHEECLSEAQQIHFGEIFFADDGDNDAEVCGMQGGLFVGGCDVKDFGVPRGELFHNEVFGAAEEDRPQSLAEFIEVLIAENSSFFVLNAIAIKEAERGAQLSSVDELHHGEEFFESILHGCSGEHEGEPGAEAFDGLGGLCFPVADALSFVEDDEIPAMLFDGEDIPEHLFVVADGEECGAGILLGAILSGPGDKACGA